MLMLQRSLFGQVKNFFLLWSVLGKVKITRFFEKALRARSAPRQAFGWPQRALRWDNHFFKNCQRSIHMSDLTFSTEGKLTIKTPILPHQRGLRVSVHKSKNARRLILHQKQCLHNHFFKNCQRSIHMSDLTFSTEGKLTKINDKNPYFTPFRGV